MPGWIVGANQTASVVGQQPRFEQVAAAFRAVTLPAGSGGWSGTPRVTRELHEGRIITRAVGLWIVPNTAVGQQYSRYFAERARDALVQNLDAIEVPSNMTFPRPEWEARGLLAYQPESHGPVSFWSSGQASQSRTRAPFGQLTGLLDVVPEQADGPGAGTTLVDAAGGAARDVQQQAQQASRDWLGDNWGFVAAGAFGLFALLSLSRSSNPAPARESIELPEFDFAENPRRNPPLRFVNPFEHESFAEENPYDESEEDEDDESEEVRENPANPHPAAWDVLAPGTPYPCESKELGREIRKGRLEGYRVESCATPLPVTDEERKRKQTGTPKPQRAYVLKKQEGKGRGHETVARGSTVREALRPDRGSVGEVPPGGAQGLLDAAAAVRRGIAEQRAAGAYFPEAPGLPYPARPASSECLPGSKPWRELEEATLERVAMLAESGVPLTREVLSAALEADPAFVRAAEVEDKCLRSKWEAPGRAKAPKTTGSTQRERAQAREAAKAAGVDLSSAEYRDTLEGEQRAKLRAGGARRRGGVRKAGGQQNPSPRVEEALAMHWDWIWKRPGAERQALNEAKHAFYESLDWREREELANEQARLSHLKRRDPARWHRAYLETIRRNPETLELPFFYAGKKKKNKELEALQDKVGELETKDRELRDKVARSVTMFERVPDALDSQARDAWRELERARDELERTTKETARVEGAERFDAERAFRPQLYATANELRMVAQSLGKPQSRPEFWRNLAKYYRLRNKLQGGAIVLRAGLLASNMADGRLRTKGHAGQAAAKLALPLGGLQKKTPKTAEQVLFDLEHRARLAERLADAFASNADESGKVSLHKQTVDVLEHRASSAKDAVSAFGLFDPEFSDWQTKDHKHATLEERTGVPSGFADLERVTTNLKDDRGQYVRSLAFHDLDSEPLDYLEEWVSREEGRAREQSYDQGRSMAAANPRPRVRVRRA